MSGRWKVEKVTTWRVRFERGMDRGMVESNMVLKEVVTDAHSEIGALMSKLAYMQIDIKISMKYPIQCSIFKLNLYLSIYTEDIGSLTT